MFYDILCKKISGRFKNLKNLNIEELEKKLKLSFILIFINPEIWALVALIVFI